MSNYKPMTHKKGHAFGIAFCGTVPRTTMTDDWTAIDCGACQKKRLAKPVPKRKFKSGPQFKSSRQP